MPVPIGYFSDLLKTVLTQEETNRSPLPIGYPVNALHRHTELPGEFVAASHWVSLQRWPMYRPPCPRGRSPVPIGYLSNNKTIETGTAKTTLSPVPIGYLSNLLLMVITWVLLMKVASSHWVSLQLGSPRQAQDSLCAVASSHWVSLQHGNRQFPRHSQLLSPVPIGYLSNQIVKHIEMKLKASRQFPLGISPTFADKLANSEVPDVASSHWVSLQPDPVRGLPRPQGRVASSHWVSLQPRFTPLKKMAGSIWSPVPIGYLSNGSGF